MEMLFLQHATGKAVGKLSPSAMRTISGCGEGKDFMQKIDLLREREIEAGSNQSLADLRNIDKEMAEVAETSSFDGDENAAYSNNSDVNSNGGCETLHIDCEIDNAILEHATSKEILSSDNIIQVLDLARGSPELLQSRFLLL